MILRLILHIEKQPGRWPRVSIKRAPYAGQRVWDAGWGWRRLIGCDTCSGVGFLDTSEGEWRYRETLHAALDSSYSPAWVEQNHEAHTPGTEPLRAPETPGLYRLVADEEGRRLMAQDDAQPQDEASGDEDRWSNEGGNGHNRAGDLYDGPYGR